MSPTKTLNRRHRPYVFTGITIALVVVFAIIMLITGFVSDIGTALSSRIQGGGLGSLDPTYFGPDSLEERIISSDAVVRVRLLSVSSGTEIRNEDGNNKYVAALIHKFEVLEYLKGSGANELVAVVHDAAYRYETKLGADILGKDLRDNRYARWDDREAIVFLADSHPTLPSSQQEDRYWFGIIDGERDYYTIRSRYGKYWLPSASSSGVSMAYNSGEQRFFTEAPPESSTASLTASGQAWQVDDTSTITLAELKNRISKLEAEINAGDGSEEYRLCIYYKYEWERRLIWRKERGFSTSRYDQSIYSGLPAGSEVYVDPGAWSHEGQKDKFWNFWLEGRDENLFTYNHPGIVYSERPLPSGEYRVYFNIQPYKYIICNAYPEEERTIRELVIQVTAPPGTLHEAFFDPTALTGSGVGFSGASGVLSPAGFSVGSASTTIQGLAWRNGSVTLTLQSYVSLDGYSLDFIGLDGRMTLSLDGKEEGSGNAATTRSWPVAHQPWKAGDKLMLRIRQGRAETLPTPTPAPTATPTPTPAITPQG